MNTDEIEHHDTWLAQTWGPVWPELLERAPDEHFYTFRARIGFGIAAVKSEGKGGVLSYRVANASAPRTEEELKNICLLLEIRRGNLP